MRARILLQPTQRSALSLAADAYASMRARVRAAIMQDQDASDGLTVHTYWARGCGRGGGLGVGVERSKQKCDLRRDAQSFQPAPEGLERIYPRDTKDWPEAQYKPGVQLNPQLALHTAAVEKLTEPTAIGQTVTQYGGAMPNCGQLYANPAGTMARLSTGETHAPWWALSGAEPLEQ
jgi:hypothetical protein